MPDHPRAPSRRSDARLLLALAAGREARAAMEALGVWAGRLPDPWQLVGGRRRLDLVMTGVGKANAAGGVARVLDPNQHWGVLSAGIAGSLPVAAPPGLGTIVCASESVFADEGVGGAADAGGFIPMSDLGFGCFPDGSMGARHDQTMLGLLSPLGGARGVIATVSWCSGSDGCAQGVVERTGAIAEAMEGAAVALAARRVSSSIATGELRVISNTTGERSAQRWDPEGALATLRDVLGRLAGSLD